MGLERVVRNRHYLKKITRQFFYAHNYLEVDSPVLTICPGTEVHLQYFETKWIDMAGFHHRRYLRSSPELHMKRIIAAGSERIFQIGPCFRNVGERGPWHNPEFSMLEWYQVGQTYKGLIDETELFLRTSAAEMEEVTGFRPESILPSKIERLSVYQAFQEFCHIELEDHDPELAAKAKAAGVFSVKPDDNFETAFFKILIEKIEPAIEQLGGCVLYDYPPSQAAMARVESGRACRFEFYIGRIELCNGFYELTGEAENRARALECQKARGAAGYEVVPVDNDFLNSMANFSAPCAGNALGFDRWLAILSKGNSLDDGLIFAGV